MQPINCFYIYLDNFYMEIILKMSEFNPSKRITVFEILEKLINN